MKRILLIVSVLVTSAVAGSAAACSLGDTPFDWNGCPVYLSCQQPPAEGPYIMVQANFSTGFVNPTRTAAMQVPGYGTYRWYYPTNIYAIDIVAATSRYMNAGATTTLLPAFGFDFGTIQPQSVIKKLSVRVTGYSMGHAPITYMRLLDSTGTLVGRNVMEGMPRELPTRKMSFVISGDSTFWGFPLDAVGLKGVLSGVAIGATANGYSNVWVDNIAMAVEYSCQ